MAMAPQAMLMLRNGAAQGPVASPGGMPQSGPQGADPQAMAGLPANAGNPDPSSLIMQAIAQKMNEQRSADTAFLVNSIDQMMRVCATMVVQVSQSQPDVARHINKAWSSLDSAKREAGNNDDQQSVPTGPPLGFSGAQMGGQPGNGTGSGMM